MLVKYPELDLFVCLFLLSLDLSAKLDCGNILESFNRIIDCGNILKYLTDFF